MLLQFLPNDEALCKYYLIMHGILEQKTIDVTLFAK